MHDNLEPIEPGEAMELYLADKEGDLAKATLRSHRSRLKYFVEWCQAEGIENLNNLTGRKLKAYQIWRRNDGDLAPASEKTQMDTVRVFIKWLEDIEGCPPDLAVKVQSPSLSPDENTRDVKLESEVAEEVLTYLEKYHYCTLPHVTLSLLWNTMMRRGAARALDVDDYSRDDQYLEVVHRPETDTPLKNQEGGERFVALSDSMCELLNDWVDDQRPNVTDSCGRKPLLASSQGRLHVTTIQQYAYGFTRPCEYGKDCPHSCDPQSCEAANERDSASKCPSSISPHAIRRGGITHWLREDVPGQVISDRADVSADVLDQHYDRRTERERMEQRRSFLDNI